MANISQKPICTPLILSFIYLQRAILPLVRPDILPYDTATEGGPLKRSKGFKTKPHLCLLCDKTTNDFMCKSCRKHIIEMFGLDRVMTYCKRCKQSHAPERAKHGLSIANIQPNKLLERVLIVYEEVAGCPHCRETDATVLPHAVITRIAS